MLFNLFLSLLILCVYCKKEIFFKDTFNTDPFKSGRWVVSNANSAKAGKLEWSGGLWGAGDRKGIRTMEDAKFYSFSTKLEKSINFDKQTLVFGFRVKHEQNIDCGGGYAKLINEDGNKDKMDQSSFGGSTNYSIMFGPDICGHSTKKVHAIINYNNSNLEKLTEISAPSDEFTHTYILTLKPKENDLNNLTYDVTLDLQSKANGSLTSDWKMESESREINDPNESKPKDWIDEQMIDDATDKKPKDWQDEAKIDDKNATQPEDWDEEEDGKWTPPKIDNPKFKGPWKPKQIKNPKYKGEWEHPKIANPAFVAARNVNLGRSSIRYIGVEIWQVKSGTVFSDFVLANDVELVKEFFEQSAINNDDEAQAKKAFDEKNKPKQPKPKQKAKAKSDSKSDAKTDANDAKKDEIKIDAETKTKTDTDAKVEDKKDDTKKDAKKKEDKKTDL